MKFSETSLEGVYIIDPGTFKDKRGTFVKPYSEGAFDEVGVSLDLKESFYSRSKRHVIRGMHFQVPPHDYAKLVFVTDGEIVDVILDIRQGMSTYGKFISVGLSADNARQVYVPRGFAHGFAVVSHSATVVYLQTAAHAPEHDGGIKWNSFGMNWGIEDPIVSPRDEAFSSLDEFDSPFSV
jgi:dTDP-4-dehydrorhamnose 3,5-epimerase